MARELQREEERRAAEAEANRGATAQPSRPAETPQAKKKDGVSFTVEFHCNLFSYCLCQFFPYSVLSSNDKKKKNRVWVKDVLSALPVREFIYLAIFLLYL